MANISGPQNFRDETVTDVSGVSTAVRPVVAREVVAQPAYVASAAAMPVQEVRSSRTRRFAPDAVVAAAVGLVLFVVGLLAMVRAGFDEPLNGTVVEVVGLTHTTALGVVTAAFGGLLLLAGATSSRSGALFVGSVLGIAGFVGAVQAESFVTSLALESSYAWIATLFGVLVVASALLLPRSVSRTSEMHAR